MNHEQEMGQNDIWNLSGQETELAYQAEDRFLFIQDTEGGYDYTFYGMDYREIDGGIYEDSDDMTIHLRESSAGSCGGSSCRRGLCAGGLYTYRL